MGEGGGGVGMDSHSGVVWLEAKVTPKLQPDSKWRFNNHILSVGRVDGRMEQSF